MAEEYALDTHPLVWYLEGNPRLGRQAKAVMDDPASALVLPVIALAEATYIVERGRTAIPSPRALLAAVYADVRIVIAPLSAAIVEEATRLTAIPEMHDRLIVATARFRATSDRHVILLTRDGEIRDAGLVATLW